MIITRKKQRLKRQINNPYSINWKMYAFIGAVSVIIMIGAVAHNNACNDLLSEIVKNLAFGCVASTTVAFLIEIGNVREKNKKANDIYDEIYSGLRLKILWYIETWARLYVVASNDQESRQEKHTWIEWYEKTKNCFLKCSEGKQERLLVFFKEQLKKDIEAIEEAIEHIKRQEYILNINGMYNQEINGILDDYSFEFSAAKMTIEIEDGETFWTSFDAIKEDLIQYINNWVDIRYYNYYRFKPYDFIYDKTEILLAIKESEKRE